MARRGRKGRETADKADASAKSHNERGEDSSALKKVAKKPQGGFLKKSRAYFLAGILVTAPISIQPIRWARLAIMGCLHR